MYNMYTHMQGECTSVLAQLNSAEPRRVLSVRIDTHYTYIPGAYFKNCNVLAP